MISREYKPKPLASDDPGYQSAAARIDQLRIMNIMHLVDLKRAGHSPRETEFRILPERNTHFMRAATGSYLGSPGALCAAESLGFRWPK